MNPALLKRLLSELNLSYSRCGKIAGCSRSSIYAYSAGYHPIPPRVESKILSFAKSKGVDPESFKLPNVKLNPPSPPSAPYKRDISALISQEIHRFVSLDTVSQGIIEAGEQLCR